MDAAQSHGEQWTDLPLQRNYLFVFMIVGLITLLPLIILTVVVTLRTGIPKICRFICLCATLALGAGVGAMVFIHFAMGTRDFNLARGDQIMVGQPNDGYLVGITQLHAVLCNRLTVQSNRPGVMVWAISVSVNRGPGQNYSLTMQNWSLPTHARIRLNKGDQIRIRNFTNPIRAVLLKGEVAWTEWNKVDTQQLGYEKCCAWKDLEPESPKNDRVEADADDIYTVILRYDNRESSAHLRREVMVNNFTGSIDLQRVRWAPTPCDPIICDGSNMYCEADSTPKRYIVDYTVHTMTAPPYTNVNVRLICNLRHWALGLIFSIVPIIVIILTLVVWRSRRNSNQLTFLDTMGERTVPTTHTIGHNNYEPYDRQNPAFELDIV
ncbi:uncharacterized protein DEA37_0006358 [Paragonimus westermani]|uniref:DUF5730 domain-containing protein n=1 Tax=Paragonimus westermani TaxID=34504 RepID=A0A5J4N6D7_9TREM|nr:uncharacterized protein DEA37_0010817 [Paragonimus westermani]KAA3671760.1 uncharacterized protein DEA37_0006704 [Paragonimus westermani]KAA3675349.1 uncharacterized protein DEA37_0006358 [Paragonimus westermani]